MTAATDVLHRRNSGSVFGSVAWNGCKVMAIMAFAPLDGH
jgi:predicted phosphatase